MSRAGAELPVIIKTYDLVLWTAQHVAKFPRGHRFTLGERLENKLLSVLEELIRAKFAAEKAALLRGINLELEVLRFHFRLASDLKCLSTESYGFAARSVDEIGRMVGGWLKQKQGAVAYRPDHRSLQPAGGGAALVCG